MFKWIKRILPDAKKIKESRSVKWLSSWIKNRPYLWQLTKHSVAASVAISLFVSFIPLPIELILVTVLVIVFRANFPIAFFSIWITSPITLVPASYLCYKVGAWILHNNHADFKPFEKIHFHWHDINLFWNDVTTVMNSLGVPYLIGFPIVSFSVAVLSYCTVYFLWSGAEWLHKK